MRDELGVALLEFLIVFPVLIMLLFGAIEVSHGLAVANESLVSAREIATALFHECKDKDLTDSVTLSPQSAARCLAMEVATIHKAIQRTTPHSAVIATIFRNNGGATEILAGPFRSCPPSLTQSPAFECSQLQTQFPLDRANQQFGALLQTTGWAVLVETYVEKSGTLERVLMPMFLEGENYYSAAIL